MPQLGQFPVTTGANSSFNYRKTCVGSEVADLQTAES